MHLQVPFFTDTIRVNNLTRHLLYKLIKYTLSMEELTSEWNSPTTLDPFDFDFAYDVEILHKKNVVIDCTFEEYENLSCVVFPVSIVHLITDFFCKSKICYIKNHVSCKSADCLSNLILL